MAVNPEPLKWLTAEQAAEASGVDAERLRELALRDDSALLSLLTEDEEMTA